MGIGVVHLDTHILAVLSNHAQDGFIVAEVVLFLDVPDVMAVQIAVVVGDILPGVKDFFLTLKPGRRRRDIIDGVEDGRKGGGPDNVGYEKYGWNDQCHDGQDDKSVG